MKFDLSRHEGTARIGLSGVCDAGCYREFRTVCDGALSDPATRAIEIDFGGVELLDGSMLGVLLVVREYARAAKREVRLANCRGAVGDVLAQARFGRLFAIK